MINLNEEEWRLVLFGLTHAHTAPGFNSKYNPLPWVEKFEEVLAKIRAEIAMSDSLHLTVNVNNEGEI